MAGATSFFTHPNVQFIAVASAVAIAGPGAWAAAGAYTGAITYGGVTLVSAAGLGQAAVAVGSAYAIARAADDTIGQVVDHDGDGVLDQTLGQGLLTYFTRNAQTTDDILLSADIAVVVVELGPGIFKSIKGVATFAENVVTGSVKAIRSAGDDFVKLLRDPDTYCFAPETLVSTEDGKRLIGDIRPGDRVYSFDFESNGIVFSRVIATKHNSYTGKWVSLTLDSGEKIEVTGNHPFWVSAGADLDSRPIPVHDDRELREETQTNGKWVFSQDLLPGDVFLTRTGEQAIVTSVEVCHVEDQPICNLTVESCHNFFVSASEALAHNGENFCVLYQRFLPAGSTKPAALLNLAKELGKPETYVHAHHIVQKVGTGILGKIYSSRSQKILAKAEIELLEDVASFERAGSDGLHNMCYALNGRGTHTTRAQRYVCLELEKIQKDALKTGDDLGVAVKSQLAEWKQRLESGNKIWEPLS